MTKRKTTEQFKREVYALVQDEFVVRGEYISANTHVLMKHMTCGNSYPVLPANFLRGKRCPYCYGNKKKDTDHFKKEVYNLVGTEYSVRGEYINTDTHIVMRHNVCGNEYSVTPYKFLSGRRCPKCMSVQRNITHTKTTDKFKKEVRELTGNEYEVTGEYIYALEHIKIRHAKCGLEYEVTPANFLNGKRCPRCNESHGQIRIRKFFLNKEIKYKNNKMYPDLLGVGGRKLQYDFYIPSINLLIEYQGEQHEKPVDFTGKGINDATKKFLKQQEHDRRKREYAKINNIPLLEIWYRDFDNIESILEETISKLGKTG